MIATKKPTVEMPAEVNEFFRKHGARGGKLGGPARMASLTEEQQSELTIKGGLRDVGEEAVGGEEGGGEKNIRWEKGSMRQMDDSKKDAPGGEDVLTSTAKTIGTTLGKIAATVGLAPAGPPAKPVRKKLAPKKRSLKPAMKAGSRKKERGGPRAAR